MAKMDGYRVCVIGNGVIRNLGISAPYKGALKEEKIKNIMGEGKSINFLQENDASGCLLTPADITKNGGIEGALEFYGYRRLENTYFVEKYAELGTEGFHKTGDDLIVGKIEENKEEGTNTEDGDKEEGNNDQENKEGTNSEANPKGDSSESGEPNAETNTEVTVKTEAAGNVSEGKPQHAGNGKNYKKNNNK